MKKVGTFILCMVMLVSLSGCAGVLTTVVNAVVVVLGEDESKKISTEVTSGEFVLDGVVYKFPMDLQYWLDNGWHTPDNYENKDVFRLESGITSTEFELHNSRGRVIYVSVINNSLTDAKVEDCMVSSVYIPLDRLNVTLPKGITKKSKLSEAVTAYGEPDKDEESKAAEAIYSYTSDSDWDCRVQLNVSDGGDAEYKIASVEYYLVTFSNLMERMISEKGEETVCKFYVDTNLNATYKGDFHDYTKYCFNELVEAEAVHQSAVDYYAKCLMYFADIDEKYITSSQARRLNNIANKVLENAKWEIKTVSLNEDRKGKLTIAIYPKDFARITYDAVCAAIDNYYIKHKDVDFNAVSDVEFEKLEEEYIDTVIGVFDSYVSKVGALEPILKTYDIDFENGVFTDEQWYEIDDYIMDIETEA